eukprot:6192907-Pleurochrysis_carterae.AAC.3
MKLNAAVLEEVVAVVGASGDSAGRQLYHTHGRAVHKICCTLKRTFWHFQSPDDTRRMWWLWREYVRGRPQAKKIDVEKMISVHECFYVHVCMLEGATNA